MPHSCQIKLKSFVSIQKLLTLVEKSSYAFFLDSSDLEHANANYSYFSWNPAHILEGPTALKQLSEKTSEWIYQKPAFDFWAGGYFGWVPYEGAPAWFGYYPAVLVLDQKTQQAWAVSETLAESDLSHWLQVLENELGQVAKVPAQKQVMSCWQRQPSFEHYNKCFNRVKDHLIAGDVYQINLTQEFQISTKIQAATLYEQLRHCNPSPYGAFVNKGDSYILSASPELFFSLNDDKLMTKPIKGTRQRVGTNSTEAARELLVSSKDRAELLMITDLERNDVGRLCETGQVKVEKLCELESFATVHHLVSTISGKLRKNLTLENIFEALFPGGSITGAPKIRSMQIIKELEQRKRGLYTGALGFVGKGISLFNLPIRTMIYDHGLVRFATGGGIVVDSKPELEYEELWWKALGMLNALGLERK